MQIGVACCKHQHGRGCGRQGGRVASSGSMNMMSSARATREAGNMAGDNEGIEKIGLPVLSGTTPKLCASPMAEKHKKRSKMKPRP